MTLSIFSWTCEPVVGPTRNAYRDRTGYRRTLWILFIPIFTSIAWDQNK